MDRLRPYDNEVLVACYRRGATKGVKQFIASHTTPRERVPQL